MNIAKLRTMLELPGILAKLGVDIQNKDDFFCLSPFNKEETPSCHIRYKNGRWVFYDFSSKNSGDEIALLKAYYNTDFKGALAKWEELATGYVVETRNKVPIQRQAKSRVNKTWSEKEIRDKGRFPSSGIIPECFKVMSYTYIDIKGVHHGSRVRYELWDNGVRVAKTFRDYLKTRGILYNEKCLRGLTEGDSVFLAEGEKDVSTLLSQRRWSVGYQSADIDNHMNRWVELLKPFNVTVYTDNDSAGERAAQAFEKHFKVVRIESVWDSAPHGADITDYFKHHQSMP